jgi:hypothetical protein
VIIDPSIESSRDYHAIRWAQDDLSVVLLTGRGCKRNELRMAAFDAETRRQIATDDFGRFSLPKLVGALRSEATAKRLAWSWSVADSKLVALARCGRGRLLIAAEHLPRDQPPASVLYLVENGTEFASLESPARAVPNGLAVGTKHAVTTLRDGTLQTIDLSRR